MGGGGFGYGREEPGVGTRTVAQHFVGAVAGDIGAVDLAQVMVQHEESVDPRSFGGLRRCRRRCNRTVEVVGAEENGFAVPVF